MRRTYKTKVSSIIPRQSSERELMLLDGVAWYIAYPMASLNPEDLYHYGMAHPTRAKADYCKRDGAYKIKVTLKPEYLAKLRAKYKNNRFLKSWG